MIKKIQLAYVQPHKSTTLNLDPGVNIIKGTSHGGKSSVMRGIKWNLLNKPRGDSLRSHFAPDKSPTMVSIQFDDGFVTREKGKNLNRYKIKGNKFEAMRSDVPFEVQQTSRMTDLNIQAQHDPYFLIQDTPGQVGKKLNEIVGLQDIDRTITAANSIIKKLNGDKKLIVQQIAETEVLIKGYKNVPKYRRMVSDLDDQMDELSKVEDELNDLFELQKLWVTLKEALEAFSDVEAMDKEVDELLDQIQAHRNVLEQIQELTRLRGDIKDCQDNIENTTQWLACEEQYLVVARLMKEDNERGRERSFLFDAHATIRKLKGTIDYQGKAIKVYTGKYDKRLKDAKICPMCGKKI